MCLALAPGLPALNVVSNDFSIKHMPSDKNPQKALPGTITSEYLEHVHQKMLLLILLLGAMVLVAVYAIMNGTYDIPIQDILRSMLNCSCNSVQSIHLLM